MKQMKSNQKTKTYQLIWGIITALLIFFPPAGIILAVIYGHNNSKKHPTGDKSLLTDALAVLMFGGTAIFIGFFMKIGKPDYTRTGNAFMIFYIPSMVCAVYMLRLYLDSRKREQTYYLCRTIVLDGHLRKFVDISNCLSKSMDETEEILIEACERGILNRCTINSIQRCVEVDQYWANREYTCQNCGATMHIDIGANLVCLYCGGPIK